MSNAELLVPYTQFQIAELATQLHTIVVDNEAELAARNLAGVIVRYGRSLDDAQANAAKGQRADSPVDHYAVVNPTGDVVGSASMYPDLPLKKLHLPIPAGLAIGPLAETYEHAVPNIHAWTDIEEVDLLAGAYKELLDKGSRLGSAYRVLQQNAKPTTVHRILSKHDIAWTIEPVRSPAVIHEAVAKSGLTKVATRRFDDAESKRNVPPRATLYADIHKNDWMSAHGMQKELRTGRRSFLAGLLANDDPNVPILNK